MQPKVMEVITRDVCQLLRISEEDVFNLKLEAGMRYLENRFRDEPGIRRALNDHANFWNWWRELWAQRDVKLMKACTKSHFGIIYKYQAISPPDERNQTVVIGFKTVLNGDTLQFYSQYHNPDAVVFYPNDLLISSCLSSPRGEVQRMN